MVRKRKARRKALGTRAPILIEARANARWSLDFVHDQFACGRRFRILNVVDDVTRECLAAIPDTSISGRRVVRELTSLIERRGKPGMIVSDNGTELTSNAILRWCAENRIDWHYIAPGKQMQNASQSHSNQWRAPAPCRKLQWTDARRVPERDLVPQLGSCSRADHSLGGRLQHCAATLGLGLSNAHGVRPAHDHRNRPPRCTK